MMKKVELDADKKAKAEEYLRQVILSRVNNRNDSNLLLLLQH